MTVLDVLIVAGWAAVVLGVLLAGLLAISAARGIAAVLRRLRTPVGDDAVNMACHRCAGYEDFRCTCASDCGRDCPLEGIEDDLRMLADDRFRAAVDALIADLDDAGGEA